MGHKVSIGAGPHGHCWLKSTWGHQGAGRPSRRCHGAHTVHSGTGNASTPTPGPRPDTGLARGFTGSGCTAQAQGCSGWGTDSRRKLGGSVDRTWWSPNRGTGGHCCCCCCCCRTTSGAAAVQAKHTVTGGTQGPTGNPWYSSARAHAAAPRGTGIGSLRPRPDAGQPRGAPRGQGRLGRKHARCHPWGPGPRVVCRSPAQEQGHPARHLGREPPDVLGGAWGAAPWVQQHRPQAIQQGCVAGAERIHPGA